MKVSPATLVRRRIAGEANRSRVQALARALFIYDHPGMAWADCVDPVVTAQYVDKATKLVKIMETKP